MTSEAPRSAFLTQDEKILLFMATRSSAERPAIQTPSEKIPVRNGVEKDEKSRATAVSTSSSPNVRASAESTTWISGLNGAATKVVTPKARTDQGTSRTLGSRENQASNPRIASRPTGNTTRRERVAPSLNMRSQI